MTAPPEILLVTGLSGAGKSTVLKTLEDLGWEVVDNLPLSLLDRLLSVDETVDREGPTRPLAIGSGAATRDFTPDMIIALVDRLLAGGRQGIEALFLDCATDELARRYDETRRRHPLALDRPAREGIDRERAVLEPLRGWSTRLIDTSRYNASDLAQRIRADFARPGLSEPTVSVSSFGFARGLPLDADLVFDMRFLRNPHWDPTLRPGTGVDPPVAAYVSADPAYEPAISRIEDLLLMLLPRYRAEGKSYINIAFGCTGGRHRSVHVAERVAARLREAGFSPTVTHRDLAAVPHDTLEGRPDGQ
ncbi:RNase adapter RapZ [Sphingomonas radiodurans]|uniref:RNase adapter RapZ n=1 Tax=Sphingomonas radiodurans TaxID=2890321 RepID=UPI001E51E6F0|nr:RNase adapter RapZ [Sphingomonas radiodurans]WBH16538.1 RNase adapter RapZ [Sphingomonas radiodurans]